MSDRLITMKAAFDRYFNQRSDSNNRALNALEWEVLRQMTGVLQPCHQMVVDIQGGNGGYVAESISSITNLHRSFTFETQDIRKLDPAIGTESVQTTSLMPEIQQLLNMNE